MHRGLQNLKNYRSVQCNEADIERLSTLGSCDRASWAKYEGREKKPNKMQQLDVYY